MEISRKDIEKLTRQLNKAMSRNNRMPLGIKFWMIFMSGLIIFLAIDIILILKGLL